MISLTQGGTLIKEGSQILNKSNDYRVKAGMRSLDWREIDKIYKVGIDLEQIQMEEVDGKVEGEREREERKRINRLITSLVAMKTVMT